MKSFKTVLITLLLGLLPYSMQINAIQNFQSNEEESLEAYGEYLFWQVTQDEMQYAIVFPNSDFRDIIAVFSSNGPPEISANASVVDPKFEWNSGFRIGFGYGFCSQWDIDLAWTRFHQKVNSSVFSAESSIFPSSDPLAILFGIANRDPSMFSLANEAKSHWRFEFDAIDLEIGRTCCLCQGLVLRPYIGVKAASILQKQHIEYIGFTAGGAPISIETHKKNDFRGIGPSFGFDTSWEFMPNWNLTSGVCAAWLYGKFNANTHPMASQSPGFIDVKENANKKHRLRPTVDAYLGFDWNTCLCECFEVTLGVAYEIQYWWNQWQAPSSFVGSLVNGGSSSQGDLMMQGLTVHAGLYF